MKRALLRAATVLAAVLIIGATVVSGATASPMPQRFSVPSGDNCTYGYTEGLLEWRSAAPAGAVSVTGTVVDRPQPSDPIAVCRDDGRYTIATYIAYAGNRPIDQTARRVDNGTLRIQFVLGGTTYPVGIDRLTIQVCRVSLIAPSPTPDYCGRVYTFLPPQIGPATI